MFFHVWLFRNILHAGPRVQMCQHVRSRTCMGRSEAHLHPFLTVSLETAPQWLHSGNPWKSMEFPRIFWEFSGIWAHMGPIWAHMGPIWAHIPENSQKILGNSMDFHGFPLWSHCGAVSKETVKNGCKWASLRPMQVRDRTCWHIWTLGPACKMLRNNHTWKNIFLHVFLDFWGVFN